MYFAQMCPQNAGNAVSETQNSKNFRASTLPEPPTIVSSLWPPLNKILATLLRPQLHYAGLLFIPDCLNPIRYENIGSYTAPLIPTLAARYQEYTIFCNLVFAK